MDDELRRLDDQIDKGTDDSLAATLRILSTVTDTEAIGVETLGALVDQGEIWRWCDGKSI